MSEIHLKCSGCGRSYSIPEHIADTSIKCWECGTRVDLNDRWDPSSAGRSEVAPGALKLAPSQSEPERPITDSVPPPAPSALETVLDCTREVESTPTWPGYFAFALTFGLMFAYQFQATAWKSHLDIYIWGRGIALVGLYLYITFSALHDNGWKGTLCIVFPPYALFYGVSQVNSYAVQGVLFGLVVGLGTEAYFLTDNSLFIAAGPAFSMLVDEVNSWIKLAAKPPV